VPTIQWWSSTTRPTIEVSGFMRTSTDNLQYKEKQQKHQLYFTLQSFVNSCMGIQNDNNKCYKEWVCCIHGTWVNRVERKGRRTQKLNQKRELSAIKNLPVYHVRQWQSLLAQQNANGNLRNVETIKNHESSYLKNTSHKWCAIQWQSTFSWFFV